MLPALIVNTLGVATDLSLIGLIDFASVFPVDEIAGRCFTFLASLESLGTLVGIGVLYPIYQFYLDDSTAAGGIPYYVCGVNTLLNLSRLIHRTDAWIDSLRSCCRYHLAHLGVLRFSPKEAKQHQILLVW